MARTPSLAALGAVVLDDLIRLPRLPRPNDRMRPLEAATLAGGMGGNVATAFARVGGHASFLGVFAGDADGAALRAELEREGVDCGSSAVAADRITGRTLILVGGRGARAIIYRPSPNSPPLAPTLPPFRADALYMPGNYALQILDSIPGEVRLATDIELGHAEGHPKQRVRALLDRADVIVSNTGGAAALAAAAGVRSAVEAARLCRGIFVVTRGARGATAYVAGGRSSASGFKVPAIDTTGAGDCFTAAFVLRWLEGAPMPEALRFANAAAALSTLALGARAGLPARTAVEAMLARGNGASDDA